MVQDAVPREAVAGVIRSDDGRVLLVRRNPRLKFMGGLYAFPGGSVDADDHAGVVSGGVDSGGVDSGGVVSGDAVALARELFEETGLLIVKGSLPSPDERREGRKALLDGELLFQEFLERYNLRVDGSRLQPGGGGGGSS